MCFRGQLGDVWDVHDVWFVDGSMEAHGVRIMDSFQGLSPCLQHGGTFKRQKKPEPFIWATADRAQAGSMFSVLICSNIPNLVSTLCFGSLILTCRTRWTSTIRSKPQLFAVLHVPPLAPSADDMRPAGGEVCVRYSKRALLYIHPQNLVKLI